VYEGYTPSELARALDDLHLQAPESVGETYMLHMVTTRWATCYPQLTAPLDRFKQAREAQRPDTRTEEAWRTVLATGKELAAALRELGDVELIRCQEPTYSGECRQPLPPDGQCHWADMHRGSQTSFDGAGATATQNAAPRATRRRRPRPGF
jgi:hypothetical protein